MSTPTETPLETERGSEPATDYYGVFVDGPHGYMYCGEFETSSRENAVTIVLEMAATVDIGYEQATGEFLSMIEEFYVVELGEWETVQKQNVV